MYGIIDYDIGALNLSRPEDAQVGSIKFLASLKLFGIWASSNGDGNIKIWDADGNVIR